MRPNERCPLQHGEYTASHCCGRCPKRASSGNADDDRLVCHYSGPEGTMKRVLLSVLVLLPRPALVVLRGRAGIDVCG